MKLNTSHSRYGLVGLAAAAFLVLLSVSEAKADGVKECTVGGFCYCVNPDLRSAIDKEVAAIRSMIAKQKKQNKAIGYMSIPISSGEGSYDAVNLRVAAEAKEAIENRFGPDAAWVLNPGSTDISLPPTATGTEFMLMWTRVLEGDDGLGADFDFVYFVGPREFAHHFGLDGHADMDKLTAYYDGLAQSDSNLKAIDRIKFRNYYALRASVAFSRGSHDEWDIVRAINAKRRGGDEKLGILKQLAVLFDDRSAAPGLFEDAVAAGYAGDCK